VSEAEESSEIVKYFVVQMPCQKRGRQVLPAQVLNARREGRHILLNEWFGDGRAGDR